MSRLNPELSCANPSETSQPEIPGDRHWPRSPFIPFGRKKGKLGPRASQRLDVMLPGLDLPRATDRTSLLQQLQADPDQSRLCLEIGFGNGETLAYLATQQQQDRFIGVEVFLEGVAALLGRLQQQGLTNVRVMTKNVYVVLLETIPRDSLDRVILNFPDPWPKRSHHKRRLIQAQFLDMLATRMRPTATLNLATDWFPYAQWMGEVLEKHPAFQTLYPQDDFAPEPIDWVETRFQRKAQEAGRATFHLAYSRKESYY